MAEIPLSTRVLLTVELAEHILSYLPFPDLINAELTCRTWRDIISWSPLLQQGLFMEPTAHHLSMAYQSNVKLRIPRQWHNFSVKRYTETYTIAVLHPYLTNDPSREGRGRIRFSFDWQRALTLRPEGRWRQMVVTQPPCRNVKIEFQVRVANTLFTGRDRVSDPEGVRLGLLVDRTRRLLDHPANHAESQPARSDRVLTFAFPGVVDGQRRPSQSWLERLDCYVDGSLAKERPWRWPMYRLLLHRKKCHES